MAKITQNTYPDSYFAKIDEGSRASAAAILGILCAVYQPESVVDLGCGRGAWLAAAQRLGAKKLAGFDGDWVTPTGLETDGIEFTCIDFETAAPVTGRKADLSMLVEVLEHVSESSEGTFLDALCASADVIVFSAAIPYQGGTRHMNEQPQSHWIHTFASREFEAFDIFRPAIWNNENVCWWYRDNFLLFVHRDSAVPDRDAFRTMQQPIFDIVHPANYAQKLRVCRERITNLEMQLTAATPKQPFEP